jgi:hypothetical protein
MPKPIKNNITPAGNVFLLPLLSSFTINIIP